jgi:hypothetical protein
MLFPNRWLRAKNSIFPPARSHDPILFESQMAEAIGKIKKRSEK